MPFLWSVFSNKKGMSRMADRIIVGVTGGAIRHGHFRVRSEHLDFFPEDVCCKTGETPGRKLSLYLDGSQERIEQTYILTDKGHFFDRSNVWERFYTANAMIDTGAEGVLYRAAIEEVEPYRYRIYRVW